MWASMMALVLGVMAASILLASMLCVARSTSTNTGTAPNCRIGLTVVGKPAATPMTSSPGLIARSPSFGLVSVGERHQVGRRAGVDGDQVLDAQELRQAFLELALKRPVVSQPSSEASTISCSSLAPMTLPDTGTGAFAGHEGLGRVARSRRTAGPVRRSGCAAVSSCRLEVDCGAVLMRRVEYCEIWLQAEGAHVLAGQPGPVPVGDARRALSRAPARAPAAGAGAPWRCRA